MPLGHVGIDWIWLQDNLNKIIDEINTNKPLSSSTIAVNGSPNGSLLTLTNSQQGSGSGGGGTSPSHSTINSIRWHGVKWQNVDVMDASCNRSTIKVLVDTGISTDYVDIPVTPPIWTDPPS